MVKVIVFILLGLLAGLGTASLIELRPQLLGGNAVIQAEGGLAARLDHLEQKLEKEMEQRQRLQSRLENFGDASLAPDDELGDRARGLAEADAASASSSDREERREGMPTGDRDEQRIERLQESGFPASEASWIVRREKEIRLDTLYDRWQERRQAFLNSPSSVDPLAQDPLRTELGDEAYERYLDANGRPTSVRIANLIDNSPAAMAGLEAGDEIVSYNGQRVFDLGDLNAASVQGDLGESVLVEVIRDGSRIQLATERGPLGVITRRRWR